MTSAFVIGHPIAHSRSPRIHGFWLREHGLDGSYEAIDVDPAGLGAFLDRVRAGAFAGGNVTIPHKQTVFARLETVSDTARRIGAVNTIVRRPDGSLFGDNTDQPGFLANLDAEAPGWSTGLERAIVLGAGGAARAIVAALLARGVPAIDILNRSPERAEALAQEFSQEFGPACRGAPLSRFTALGRSAGLVVNTSSIGMHGTRFDDLGLDVLPRGAIVNDIVYTPLLTPLLAEAHEQGLRTVDGLGMLLHQAVPGFAAWFGVTPAVTPALRAAIVATL